LPILCSCVLLCGWDGARLNTRPEDALDLTLEAVELVGVVIEPRRLIMPVAANDVVGQALDGNKDTSASQI